MAYEIRVIFDEDDEDGRAPESLSECLVLIRYLSFLAWEFALNTSDASLINGKAVMRAHAETAHKNLYAIEDAISRAVDNHYAKEDAAEQKVN